MSIDHEAFTIDDLFERLPTDGWFLKEDGNSKPRYLRRFAEVDGQSIECCPITSGPCGLGHSGDAETIGVMAGMAKADVMAVMAAADRCPKSSYYSPALRARFLAAVGLTESTP